jgi:outer membrane protein OmpA-like peptidoglycan-associated protein
MSHGHLKTEMTRELEKMSRMLYPDEKSEQGKFIMLGERIEKLRPLLSTNAYNKFKSWNGIRRDYEHNKINYFDKKRFIADYEVIYQEIDALVAMEHEKKYQLFDKDHPSAKNIELENLIKQKEGSDKKEIEIRTHKERVEQEYLKKINANHENAEENTKISKVEPSNTKEKNSTSETLIDNKASRQDKTLVENTSQSVDKNAPVILNTMTNEEQAPVVEKISVNLKDAPKDYNGKSSGSDAGSALLVLMIIPALILFFLVEDYRHDLIKKFVNAISTNQQLEKNVADTSSALAALQKQDEMNKGNTDTTSEQIDDFIPIDGWKGHQFSSYGTLYFGARSTSIDSNTFKDLDMLVYRMKKNRNYRVSLEGNTGNDGEETYNQSVSLGLARAVKDYLVGRGIELDRISIEGFGSRKPLLTDSTEKGRTMNRRVEILLAK